MSKERVASRLEESGIGSDRLVDVKEGSKASHDHTTYAPERVRGNYGIYATPEDPLIIVDVDDYDDGTDENALSALSRLPPTLEQKTPHDGTHRLYVVKETVDGRPIAEVLTEEFETKKGNLTATWGEVRVANQYVVGAGSELDGCDKEWCDECVTADAGKYTLHADREIATIQPADLVEVVRKDPNYSEDDEEEGGTEDGEDDPDLEADADAADILSFALNGSNDDKLKRLWNGNYSDYGGDRSEAESALATKLAFWLGHGRTKSETKSLVRKAFNGRLTTSDVSTPDLQKWEERDDDSYRDGVLEGVDEAGEHFNPVRRRKENEAADSSEGGDGSFTSPTELEERNGGYGYWNVNEETGEAWFNQVTNFTIDVNSFLFNDDERLIDMTVVPSTGEEEYDVMVPAKVFNDPRRFRDNVVIGLTTTFDGAGSDLNELRQLVGGQDAPVRSGTKHMGLHPDTEELVTPNGVLTADGWEDDPEKVFIERQINAEKAWSLSPESDDNYDAEEVLEVLELLPKSRHSSRFLPVLGWMYTAPLRPYVQEWEGQFNTLHVSGETGAGKSSTLSLAWELFGMNGQPMSCADTKFALLSAMASTNSIPIWFDEYKPGDMKDWEVDRFQELMRKTTRGGVESRGNADKSTEEYYLKSPVMISGEQSIQGPAEQRRSIETRFREDVKEDGSDTKTAFSKLTGGVYEDGGEMHEAGGYDLSGHALAYYRYVLSKEETELKKRWKESRAHVRELLTAHDITGVDDLPRQGLQTIHFGMSLYSDFAEKMAQEADASEAPDLPTDRDINDALLYIANQYGEEGGRKSHLDRFLELTSRAANEEYLEAGKHYKFVNEGKENEELALKLSSAHDRVSKYARDHALSGEDLLNSAKDYRDRMAELEDKALSYVVTHSQVTTGLNRCARIDTDAAEEELEFSRIAFGAEPRDDENEEGNDDSNDGDGPGGEQYMDLADIDRGFHDLKVEAASVLEPKPWLEAEGTLRDSTALVNFQARGNGAPDLTQGEHYHIQNAYVDRDEDGELIVEFRDGVTEVTPTDTDAQQTGLDDAAEEETPAATPEADDSTDVEASTDGGKVTEPKENNDGDESDESAVESEQSRGDVPDDAEGLLADARRLQRILFEDEPLGKSSLFAKAAERYDIAPDRAANALDKATENGLVAETPEGYEST